MFRSSSTSFSHNTTTVEAGLSKFNLENGSFASVLPGVMESPPVTREQNVPVVRLQLLLFSCQFLDPDPGDVSLRHC